MSNLLQTGPGKVQPLFNAPRLTRLRPTNAKVSMKQEQGHEEVQEVQAAEVKSEWSHTTVVAAEPSCTS